MISPLRRHARRYLGRLITATPDKGPSRQVLLSLAELQRRNERPAETLLSRDLTPYELRVFSQNGEDGVLDEILRRIEVETRTFVEFGTESGVEANCVYLADVAGWSGHFLEADHTDFRRLQAKYALNAKVITRQAFVTPDNVQELFAALEVPRDFGVLSIDVDGCDYWIWKSLTKYRPRVVIIEYNGALPDRPLVMPRDSPPWTGSGHFGASLRAMRDLATDKGYRFVYSDLCGANAFFVRHDVLGEFLPEDEVRMQAANYRLAGSRHPEGDGPYVST